MLQRVVEKGVVERIRGSNRLWSNLFRKWCIYGGQIKVAVGPFEIME